MNLGNYEIHYNKINPYPSVLRMSFHYKQEEQNQIITTSPSYKIATTYYPEIKIQNQGKLKVTRSKMVGQEATFELQRQNIRRGNIPTLPEEDASFYRRTEKSSKLGNRQERHSVIFSDQNERRLRESQKLHRNDYNQSMLSADRSKKDSIIAGGGINKSFFSRFTSKGQKKLENKQGTSISSSDRGGGFEAEGGKKKPICCRPIFLCILGLLALLGVAAALFFVFKGGKDYEGEGRATETQGINTLKSGTIQDQFASLFSDSPAVITQTTTVVRSDQLRKDGLNNLQSGTTTNTNTKTETTTKTITTQSYRTYMDENGILQKVPIASTSSTSTTVVPSYAITQTTTVQDA